MSQMIAIVCVERKGDSRLKAYLKINRYCHLSRKDVCAGTCRHSNTIEDEFDIRYLSSSKIQWSLQNLDSDSYTKLSFTHYNSSALESLVASSKDSELDNLLCSVAKKKLK